VKQKAEDCNQIDGRVVLESHCIPHFGSSCALAIISPLPAIEEKKPPCPFSTPCVMDDFMADILAAKEQKASLLDAAPLCAVKLDSEGKARACNKLFETLMGPLFKYSQYSFAKAAANDEASRKLQEAFDAVCSGDSPRVRLRNIEMLTLAGEAGLPIKAHFDWFIGPGDIKGEVTVFGDPCSDDILEQRAKDAELIDFFQNAPIALHWLSGTGHVMWANQTELDVLGYTAEEYIGQPIMQFCPDEEELVLEIFKTLGSGNIIKVCGKWLALN